MRRTNLGLLTLAAVVLLGGYLTATAQDQGAAGPTRVATVDLQAVFAGLSAQQQHQAQLQQRRTELQQQQTQRQQTIEGLQADLDLLQPGTDAYTAKEDELAAAAIELQTWLQFEQRRILRQEQVHVVGLYRSSMQAISDVAQANGYALVMFDSADPDFNQIQAAEQLRELIQNRKVLYHSPQIDITQQIIQRMNNQFNG
jgi:Skp family chaperone for outer membrane proteins